jgi:RNase P/RNase MRP subunit p30
MELRGPYDVINMAAFFGLDQAKAKVRGVHIRSLARQRRVARSP